MSDDQTNASGNSLLSWIGIYVGCLAILIVALYIDIKFGIPVGVVTYFAIGFFLNRRIGRKLAFHPHHNTLSDVTSSKLWSFFLWPLSYLFLLFHLVVDEVL